MGLGIRYTVNDAHEVKEIHRVTVHRFRISDVEDPDIWAGQTLYEWQESEVGKFVMENSVTTPSWHRQHSLNYMGYEYAIVAELEKKKYAEFLLRFGNGNNQN